MSRNLVAAIRQRGTVRTAFELLLAVQLLHLGEHLIQVAQLYLLHRPPAAARGLISTFDIEKIHFVWNLVVLAVLAWLMRGGVHSRWMAATIAWATLHTAEHGYLLGRALRSGLESQPGILGAGGWLAQRGWNLPGLTTWSRPLVHLAWNLGEVALLTLAFIAFARWWRHHRYARRKAAAPSFAAPARGRSAAITSLRFALRVPAPMLLLVLGAFLLTPDVASVQQGATRYVNRTDPTCGGHTPCYTTIQDAVTAVLPGEAIIIQPGTYTEQLLIKGKNNTPNPTEANRIVIQADPTAPVGRVVLHGAVSVCNNGYAIRFQQSNFVTLRGLTITGAGGQATDLKGGSNQNQAIHLERLRIFGNGTSECNGGITIDSGNPGTLVLNSLIYANGRNGIATTDADGGPHYFVNNTIYDNAWNGVSVTRNNEVFLVNNAITGNGTATGTTGGRFGVTREASTTPNPAGIHLLNNLICGNRLGEINGPELDATDARNLTPTGSEGSGVIASPGCQTPATDYARLAGADGVLNTGDDDVTPATSSPLIDAGMDPRTLGLDPRFNALFESDFFSPAARPRAGSPTAPIGFDIGAVEVPDAQAPTVTFLQPAANAFVRQTVTVQVQASDQGSGVGTVTLTADSQALSANLSPPPPAASIMATAPWNTMTFADGAHTLTATAIDRTGNRISTPRVAIVDNTAPDTQITGGPSGEINVVAAAFSFTGADNLTPVGNLQFAWRLDGGAFTPFSLTTTTSFSGLAEGAHIFEVKARDLAGNEDPTPASRSFTVTLPPQITSLAPTSGPAGSFVTIAGSRFTPGPTQVAFNGAPAVARSLTATGITTTVPLEARSGLVTVTTPRGVATSSQPFTVTSTQDFTLQATPAAGQVLQGTSTTYTLDLLSPGGTPFTGLATLAVDGLPAGISAVFGAPALTGGQRGTLTLTTAVTAVTGVSTLTVRATAPTDLGPATRTATITLTVQAAGRTALAGRFTFVNGAPIGGVQITLAGLTAVTDAGGNFLVLDPPAGTQMLGIDANAAQAGLPIYAVQVTLVAGQATQLPLFRITPPPPPERFVPINNSAADQVITDPRFPGASITLPAGVTITGWDGTRKTQIALERLSPDALPVPPPPGQTRSLYQVFFGTPMGGLPSGKLPVTVPNDQDLQPGETAEIWYYDAAPLPGVPAGWRLAGTGTVSEDGSRVVSDPGVGLERFCGVCGVFCILVNQLNAPGRKLTSLSGGDPIDLILGRMIVEKTDLVLRSRIPATVHRTYNPFDAFGRIAGFELPTGPGWTLSVDVVLLEESASLRRMILAGDVRISFVRQPDGTFTNSQDQEFTGAVLTAEANGAHRLRFKDGTVWRFAAGWVPRGRVLPIAGLGLLVEQADRVGNRLSIARDGAGTVRQITEPGGRSLSFTMELVAVNVARTTSVTDPLQRTVRYGYSTTSPWRLETVTDAAGGVTRYTYNAAGGIVSITDPRGITYLTNEYDAQGRVVSQIQADSGVWSFQYVGPVGAHTSATVIDPRGNATTHRFNSAGLAAATTDPLGQVTSQARDAAGRVLATTDPLGRVTRVTYDAQGNVATITDPAGNTRTFTYEPTFNRVASITAPPIPSSPPIVTTFEYDTQGSLVAITDPEQNLHPEADRRKTRITYDAFGQPRTTTDPLGNTTTFAFDTVGNLVTVADPLGNTTTRQYDGVSRLVRQTDPRGKPTTFTYDPLNRITVVSDPLGGATGFSYDGNSNVLTVADPRGDATTYTYDAMDRVATRTDPLGHSESFAYDPAGNLTRHTDRKGQAATFAYDPLNRRTGAAYVDATVAYTYDAIGRLTQATDSLGGTITNAYDPLDRPTSQTTGLGTVGYTYDALGRRTTMTEPGQSPISYSYDPASRVTAITQGSSLVQFEYDAASRRTTLTLPNGVTTQYGYDSSSRLTSLTYKLAATVLGDLAYTYDVAGARVRVAGSWARTSLPQPVTSTTYNANNQQVALGSQTLAYDLNGNLTSDGTNTYIWTARNQLASISGPVPASVVYDSAGRRTRKIINGTITDFLYDGVTPIQEVSGAVATSLLTGLGIDQYFVRTDPSATTAFLTDVLGSTVALTDIAGAVQTQYTYAPFGATTTTGAATSNPIDYTGRESDSTGLKYYRARYYHTDLQRFISEDPLRLARPTGNLYVYVDNSPLKFRDPFGLDKCSETAGAVLRDPSRFLFRFPDYVTLSGFGIFGVPLIGGSITLDQSGNVYLGGGAGYRGQSLMAGWLARPDYNQQSVERLITGVSLTGTAGGGGFGGGATVSSSCHAVELGVTSGAGFSGTFGYKAGNVLDWLGF